MQSSHEEQPVNFQINITPKNGTESKPIITQMSLNKNKRPYFEDATKKTQKVTQKNEKKQK